MLFPKAKNPSPQKHNPEPSDGLLFEEETLALDKSTKTF